MSLPADDPRAVAVVSAIRSGDAGELRRRLAETPGLTQVRIVDPQGAARTLLHVAADWPGRFPNGARIVAALIAAGADVNAAINNPQHAETPLHWAASSERRAGCWSAVRKRRSGKPRV